jgi:hypothetical protein
MLQQQSCPLCADPAVFRLTQQPHGKKFSCPHCTDFWIDESSETYLKNLPEVTFTDFRRKLSERAKKSPPGKLWVIREPRDDEIHGDGQGVAREMLKAEWIALV